MSMGIELHSHTVLAPQLDRTPSAGRQAVEAARREATPPPAEARELDEEEQRRVQELKQQDQKVRAHERAHVAAGGQYVQGGASFSYERGPDGRLYAVSGEVRIDVAPVPGDPEATIQKMQVVRRAALAPTQPSAQDRAVAAQAARQETQARLELRAEQEKEEQRSGQESVRSPQDPLSPYQQSPPPGSLLSLLF